MTNLAYHAILPRVMVAYLIDKQTKQRVVFGTDIGRIQMIHNVIQNVRPSFLLIVYIGGKWGVA